MLKRIVKRPGAGFVVFTASLLLMFALPPQFVHAGGKGEEKASEVIVRRVDSNQFIALRIYIDGKARGSLKLGETKVYTVPNGYHTIRVGFEDYQARSSEIAQFKSYNSTHVFSVTDTSIVLISEQMLQHEDVLDTDLPVNPAPLGFTAEAGPTFIERVGDAAYVHGGDTRGAPPEIGLNRSSVTLDNSIRSAFDRATRSIKKKAKIVIVNVDADNVTEGNYVLEEITLLSVNSPKNYFVIDRRWIDTYRSQNSIGIPSFENDYVLRQIGELMGAEYIVTGRLDGPGDLRRLRIKALEVRTGLLVGNSSERV